jgi:preprotein translocase subunit YajC
VEVLLPLILVLAVLYVLMIRPQRRRQQEHQSMIESAGVGEDVLTTGGIYGTVVQVEGDDLVVEIADGISVHMTRRGIAAVLPPEEDEEEADEEEEEELEEDVVEADAEELTSSDDEASVTVSEEAVTSEAKANTAAADRR